MKQLLFLLIFFITLGCKQKESDDTQNSIISEEVIGSLEVEFPTLLSEAQDKIDSWQFFSEFKNDLDNINKQQGNIRDYLVPLSRMTVLSDSILNNIPNALKTEAISSRLRVVNVRVKLLNESLQRPNSPINEITKNLDETNVAFSNLLIQINEFFEKQEIDKLARTTENIEQTTRNAENDSLLQPER